MSLLCLPSYCNVGSYGKSLQVESCLLFHLLFTRFPTACLYSTLPHLCGRYSPPSPPLRSVCPRASTNAIAGISLAASGVCAEPACQCGGGGAPVSKGVNRGVRQGLPHPGVRKGRAVRFIDQWLRILGLYCINS